MIVSSGLARMAALAATTWTYIGLGTGVTTANLGDVDLESVVGSRKAIGTGTSSGFTAYFKTMFSKLDNNNSASNITEIAIFDATTNGAGNMCFRTVASTLTWTSFAKVSTIAATISTSISFST